MTGYLVAQAYSPTASLSGSWRYAPGDSLGIFYEQVTNIIGMRELEDEGKIMAMADYSFPFPFEKNRFKDFFDITGTKLRARYSAARQYDMIRGLPGRCQGSRWPTWPSSSAERLMIELAGQLADRYK